MALLDRTVVAILIRWIILLLSLPFCNASYVKFTVVVPGDPVSGLFRSSVSLPCELSPALNAELLEVRWYRPEMYESPILHYKDQQILESSADPQFRGRVSLIGELTKGNVSLKLNNLKLQDGGDYMCYVNSGNWYDEAKTSVKIIALGSAPVLALADVGGGQINVSCLSSGWFPKPSITWRDSKGRDLTNISKNKVTVSDPEGFVSVGSWLLVSPSESEWISCSVSLSDLEVRESRILPHVTRESRAGPYITAIVFLVIISLSSISAAVILFLKLKQRQGKAVLNVVASNKEDEEKNEGLSEVTELSPLNLSCSVNNDHEHKEKQTDKLSPQPDLMSENKSEIQHNDNHFQEEIGEQTGNQNIISDSQVQTNNQTLSEESHRAPDEKKTKKKKKNKPPDKEKITIDPRDVPQFLKIGDNGRSINCPDPKAVDDELKIFALCKEKFSTGEHYWEVKVCDKPNQKLSWYVGVADETAECLYRVEFKPVNGFWVLCYEAEHGLYINDGTGPLTVKETLSNRFTTVGLCLDCDKHTLTFYDVDYNSLLYTIKIDKPNPSLSPLISPGVRDKRPVKIKRELWFF